VWNSGLTARKTANSAVYNRVLSYAGARPSNRDSVDKRIISHVKNRNGGILSQNTRRLTIPSNPNTVASNGYTNLENWLHDMDDGVQGVTSATSPTSPPSLSVQ
jgi:hypothetical protein